MSEKQLLVLVLALLLVIALAVFVYISRPDIIFKDIGTGFRLDEETQPEEQNTPDSISVEKIKREVLKVAVLQDLMDSGARGEAIWALQVGKMTLALRAEKLADPGSSRYAGWLYKDGVATPIYIGPLSKILTGEFKDSYALGFQENLELQSYKTVVVTLETNLDDLLPEKRVLTGKFK